MSNTNKEVSNILMERRRINLSTMWIFVMLNYIYCDILGLMDSNILNQFITGNVDGMIITENFLFYGAILMEIPILMVLLSRTLPFTLNRVFNMIAALIKTIAMLGTLFVGDHIASYYLFFATIEIIGTIYIFWYAFTWHRPTDI